MVSKFFDELFTMADEAKKNRGFQSTEYKTIRRVIDTLQRIYDDGTEYSDDKLDRNPESVAENIVFGIPHLNIYEDKQDNTLCYEIDNHHYDTPHEVLDYIIQDRAQKYNALRSNHENVVGKIYKLILPQLYQECMKDFSKKAEKLYEEHYGEIVGGGKNDGVRKPDPSKTAVGQKN